MKEKLFHQQVGGKIRRDNSRSTGIEANIIRRLIVELREKRPGMTNKEIAELVHVSPTTLSLAAGGRAGWKKTGPDGKTTMTRIRDQLAKLT